MNARISAFASVLTAAVCSATLVVTPMEVRASVEDRQPLEPSFDLEKGLASEAEPADTSVLESVDPASQLDALLSTIDVATQAATSGRAPASAARPGAIAPMATRAIASQELASTRSARTDRSMLRARQLVDAGKFQEASDLLFQMSRNPQFANDSAQIRYVLGLSLLEMRLNQSAAFVFYDLIRDESKKKAKGGRYLKLGLQKLALAADSLESDVLLKFAIKQVDENDFPAANRDMLFFRAGELKLFEKKFDEAARNFARVGRGSIFYAKAKYREGLAQAEAGQLDRAVAAFDELAQNSSAGGVTDKNRVVATLGKARALYQKQQFEGAIEAYRAIPRDTEQWHESLFESTWANLRARRFRSAISNFQSLHSAFYDDFFQPESLLLRSIVYLYICRYDEMDKVLDLFLRLYRPVDRDLRSVLQTMNDPSALYSELLKIQSNFDAFRANKGARKTSVVPFIAARKILKEADVRKSFSYLQKLNDERRRIASLPGAWASTGVGRYSTEVVKRRIQATQESAGREIRRHMITIVNDLRDLFEQADLLRLERLTGRKEALKKEIAGKGLSRAKIEEETQRAYLIQNGYEYWPFKGEYWLDEIGNYHFVGTQACDQ